jgi:hypothetical protein
MRFERFPGLGVVGGRLWCLDRFYGRSGGLAKVVFLDRVLIGSYR